MEPSKIAAFLRGPNTRSPSASNASTTPPTSGSSIPITVRSIFFSFANATNLSNSIAPIGTHSAISPIPALPGAQYIFSTFGLCATFHAIACSLPPLPTINTFIVPPVLLPFHIMVESSLFHLQPVLYPEQLIQLPVALFSIPPAPLHGAAILQDYLPAVLLPLFAK